MELWSAFPNRHGGWWILSSICCIGFDLCRAVIHEEVATGIKVTVIQLVQADANLVDKRWMKACGDGIKDVFFYVITNMLWETTGGDGNGNVVCCGCMNLRFHLTGGCWTDLHFDYRRWPTGGGGTSVAKQCDVLRLWFSLDGRWRLYWRVPRPWCLPALTIDGRWHVVSPLQFPSVILVI